MPYKDKDSEAGDIRPMNRKVLLRSLCFYSPPPDGHQPRYMETNLTQPGAGQRNYDHYRKIVPIYDIRNRESSFDVAKNSFTPLPNAFHISKAISFDDEDDVRARYLPEVENIIFENVKGSQKVLPYDVVIRKASSVKVAHRQVNKLHVDQSPRGAYKRATKHFPKADSDAIIKGNLRLRIINLWKPIYNIVHDHPLVFADHRSLKPGDMIPVEQAYPDYVGETYCGKYRPGQQFWYWSDMRTEDVLLLQCFDSQRTADVDGGLEHVQCLHGSFELDTDGLEPCDRASVEVRCLVLG
ncbi:Fe(II)/2-oxoglutarate-dependent dioxygenase nvfI [Fulvia fulva]|uniref:Fe(II)/2-oxoglutarate-dependent dioxygenase nvfI n=1 Tax=Passalora fulva TaxID=5499 RepID=A0A9Q8UR59_PASFU|nr:Fe(II)/2-oxoglutarate-dependent dioxygenase nvfI [Fulvia fulva]KAK4621955.1 Fe(II)/2-oxoglutarate-dependent dioxygenase nvfI [Fulvia fulva]KAK4622708.1 Fe(II)/2-oxoglutarate-dependent dioxygenase nvfI [Fulvia fulva]UJO19377.1 Fe(II)/2-oxoglutarate-dependent dioxygenase nvfI [Fulvia fulva]WPV15923.1 Fe(II)/2-oxoglutarate-dependent dioxygenase nvfI [Fulvia fulva]WPV30766.1 Fe(II)/2-oxoglutarate-dependent dioxygenase nvfI [Fulvia fulva]